MSEASTVALIQQLYIAYYGRPADPDGLAYWIEYFSGTGNLDQALAAFGTSAEFTERYGNLPTTALVNGLYRQLFNREADASGLAFYSEQLDSGAATLASIALNIANGAQNADRSILDNKIAVATAYTAEITTSGAAYGSAQIDAVRALLAAVDATGDSVAVDIGRPVVVLLNPPDQVDEYQVNTFFTSGYQYSPSVTGLSDGGWVVTWNSYEQDDFGYNTYGQAYHANGSPQGAEFRVNTFTSDERQVVTGLSDGGWVVTWYRYEQDGSDANIYGHAYHANGTTQGAEFRVNTFTNGYQENPSVTGLSDGGWVVTWSSSGQHGGGVYGQAYHANGAPQGAEFRVNTFTSDYRQGSSSVTGLSDGGWVVTWDSHEQDGPGASIYGQAYHANGAPQGAEFRVNTFTSGSQVYPSVTGLSDGGWVVTWTSDEQDGSGSGVYGQAYHADGTPQGTEFRVSTFTNEYRYLPSVTGLSDGGWVVAWNGRQDGSGQGVYGQAYHANGAPQGAEFRVNTFTSGNQASPSVTGLSDGGWVVTWRGVGIYGKTYNADGTARLYDVEPVPVIYSEGGEAVAIYPNLALFNADSSGLVSAVVSLSDFRAGDRLTVERNYALPGGIGATYHNDTGAVTLAGAASLADYEAALEHIVYSSSADLSGTSSRTIELVVYDGTDSNGRAIGGAITTDHASDPVFTAITVAGSGSAGALGVVEVVEAPKKVIEQITKLIDWGTGSEAVDLDTYLGANFGSTKNTLSIGDMSYLITMETGDSYSFSNSEGNLSIENASRHDSKGDGNELITDFESEMTYYLIAYGIADNNNDGFITIDDVLITDAGADAFINFGSNDSITLEDFFTVQLLEENLILVV